MIGNRVHSVVLDFAHPARVPYPRRQAKGYRLVHPLCREGSAKLIERFSGGNPQIPPLSLSLLKDTGLLKKRRRCSVLLLT